MNRTKFKTNWLKVALVLIAFTAVAGIACAKGCQGEPDDCERPHDCCLLPPPPPAARLDTVKVFSAKMGRDITNVVVLPSRYNHPGDTARYPVVYLLHGYDGTCFDWPAKTDLRVKADQHGVIIVCPDGQDSWYFDSPIDPKMQFETFVAVELREWVDSHYRTLADPQHRAITGLSMGGHGALWLAFRHPDVYGACGCMSGGVDITKFPGRWRIADRLGPYEANRQRWADHSVINLVPQLKPGQHIIIDDGYDDIFYQVNLSLHDALLKHGIGHEFTVRPGNHSWKYWTNSIDYHLLFFSNVFGVQTSPALPKPPAKAKAPAKVHAKSKKRP